MLFIQINLENVRNVFVCVQLMENDDVQRKCDSSENMIKTTYVRTLEANTRCNLILDNIQKMKDRRKTFIFSVLEISIFRFKEMFGPN